MPDTLVEIWQANACGRYIHTRRSASGAARSEFHRRGPHRHRQRRLLPVRHRQAGRLSVGQSPQCLAAGPHPFLGVRPFVPVAAGDADVFSGRLLFPFDPIFNSVTDEKARARMVSSFDLDNTMPDWALCYPLRHRAARPRGHADGDEIDETNVRKITPSQTVGPFFAYGLTPRAAPMGPDGPMLEGNRHRQSGDAGRDRRANPYRGPGVRRRRYADQRRMMEIWQADAQGRYADPRDNRALPNAKFKGFGRSATDKDGDLRLRHHQAGPVPDPTARRRRRISWSASSPAACCGRSTRGIISPTRRPTPPIRS